MAGQTSSNPAYGNFTSVVVTKSASIGEVIFNDEKGPRAFINSVHCSLYKENGATKITYSFNTNGELGGGIHKWGNFQFQLLNKGNAIYTSPGLQFEGPCRGGNHFNSGTADTTGDIFDNTDGILILPMTVDIWGC
jgi:hypothetical protein